MRRRSPRFCMFAVHSLLRSWSNCCKYDGKSFARQATTAASSVDVEVVAICCYLLLLFNLHFFLTLFIFLFIFPTTSSTFPQLPTSQQEVMMGAMPDGGSGTRNATACYYTCCCPCMGCATPKKEGQPSASCLVHAGKWFICHPCYVAQGLRASKMALGIKRKLAGVAGAADCNEMER